MLLKTLGFCIFLISAIFAYEYQFEYKESGVEFVPLRRTKRGAYTATENATDPEEEAELFPEGFTTPADGLILLNETLFGNASTEHKTDNHIYYNVTNHEPDKKTFDKFWIDVRALLEKEGVRGAEDHPQLKNSYRRAVSKSLQFDFPFYGHLTRNFTIATGGFCYVGDYMHSWLAATQYIAPLMANFETTANDSTILYADSGKMMVVEWNNVTLRHQKEAGKYSFQVSLHENGSIWMVYKTVPTPATMISDAHHPRKVGLSDAYLFQQHRSIFPTLNKRVIYEYHRVELGVERVRSLAVFEINPNPVCIAFESCGSCMQATLQHFNCSWCASDAGPFCSDNKGFNRRRQDWLKSNCKEQGAMVYCTKEKESKSDSSEESKISTKKMEGDASEEVSSKEDTVSDRRTPDFARSNQIIKEKVSGGSSVSGGAAVAVGLAVVLVVVVACWVLYAYNNPHTPSGQLLIRYRPSRWRWPGDHGDVRYTASVHM